MKVSCSEINTFLGCRREWDYSSPNMRNLTSRRQYPALVLGKAVHEALERWYRDGVDLVETFLEWSEAERDRMVAAGDYFDLDAFIKNRKLGATMLLGYRDAYGTDTPDAFGVAVYPNTEQEFQVAIPGTADGWLVGRLDGLCRDQAGRVWVIDHKTYSSRPMLLANNLQIAGYTWAANLLARAGLFAPLGIPAGTRVYGVLYNGLRKQLPGPNVKQPLFHREFVRRSGQELELVEQMLRNIHSAMTAPDVALYPTYSKDCEWCSYQSLCLQQNAGEDIAYTIRNEYRRAERRGSVYADAEADGTDGA